MKIAILGTGMVGRAHAEKLSQIGHEVMFGTQDVEKTLHSEAPDAMGNPGFSSWYSAHSQIKVASFAVAAEYGELIIEALNGQVAVSVLTRISDQLAGKILIDIANSLDFSKGMPPSLSVCNTDSLGEQIQKALPQTKVVKTLNTVTAMIQANPLDLANGDHHIFMSGNDEAAKKQVTQLLQEWYGWRLILDLGDMTTARGTEMYLPLWLSIFGKVQNPLFSIKVIVEEKK